MRLHRYCCDGRILCAVAVFVVMIVAGIYVQPGFSTPTPRVAGDEKIVAFLTPLLKGARGHVAAALITPDGVQYGIWGEDDRRQFEVASLTKTMTASLLIEAIRRGEVTAQTRVGDVVPEIAGPARNITLEALASHRSGLPSQPFSLRQKGAILGAILMRKNPWKYDQAALAEIINHTRLASAGAFAYSNAGYALLGLALERAAHQPFAALMKQRLFDPAKMQDSVIAQESTPPSPLFAPGWSASGFTEAPWILHAFAPDGGARSTIVDMAKYAQALMAEKLAGRRGMAPRFGTDDADTRVGYAWFTTSVRGRNITWHDGQHAGYASVMAFDLQRKTAVVILSDTAWPVIGPAIRLLLAQPAKAKA